MRFLIFFPKNHHAQFVIPEVRAIAETSHFPLSFPDGEPDTISNSLAYIDVPSYADALKICQRSTLLRGVYLPLADVSTPEELFAAAAASAATPPSDPAAAAALAAALGPDTTFRVTYTTFGRHIRGTMPETRSLVPDLVTALGARGTVDLSDNAAHTLHLVAEPVPAPRYFLGLALPAATQRHAVHSTFRLPDRAFLGPTSMDAELASIMVGVAGVQPGMLALEPFFGTGSVAVALAAAGATVVGVEFTDEVIKGARTREGSFRSNFAQYGLPLPAVVRGDSTRLPLRDSVTVDAIVTDPPYGIKASVGGGLERDIYLVTLEFAAARLTVGGRLVMWHADAEDMPAETPAHPAMRLCAAPEQRLSGRAPARRLLVYQKVAEVAGEGFIEFGEVVRRVQSRAAERRKAAHAAAQKGLLPGGTRPRQ